MCFSSFGFVGIQKRTKRRFGARNIICNTRGARSRRVNRTRVYLSVQAQAQDDPIKLCRVRVCGDDLLIGVIHVSSAESARRTDRRNGINRFVPATRKSRDVARSLAR